MQCRSLGRVKIVVGAYLGNPDGDREEIRVGWA